MDNLNFIQNLDYKYTPNWMGLSTRWSEISYIMSFDWMTWRKVWFNCWLACKFSRFVANWIIIVSFKSNCFSLPAVKLRRTKKCFTWILQFGSSKTTDNLCKGFPMRLWLCLESEGWSISNLLWMLGEKEEMDKYENIIGPRSCWSSEEDERLYQLMLTHGTKWQFFE